MKIEEGKFYRTRDGRKVGPMGFDGLDAEFPWIVRGSGGFWSSEGMFCHGEGASPMDLIAEWADEPTTLWRDMTPEEKGALLLACHENRTLQMWYEETGEWEDLRSTPLWADICAYRVKPQPVRETVTWYWSSVKGVTPHSHRDIDAVFTMDLIDGKPDCNSVKMEEL